MMNPIQVIEELGVEGRLPVEAIRAAQADRERMAPIFLRTIEDFLDLREPVDPNALFFMFHLLGEWRERSAYGPLAVLLQLPPDVIDTILGEAISETILRVMVSVFDGDPGPLYAIIRNPEADEYVRARMCQTIAVLTWRGQLPRDATVAFLRDCFSQLEPQKDCYIWRGWIDAVAWLGLIELKPQVKEVFRRGSVDPMWCTFRNFEDDLQYAIDHPNTDPPCDDFTPFGDTVAELSQWTDFKPKLPRLDEPDWERTESEVMPHRDPLRKVGRNDPCPCGSGKKYKKCCLKADSDSPSKSAPPWDTAAPAIRNR